MLQAFFFQKKTEYCGIQIGLHITLIQRMQTNQHYALEVIQHGCNHQALHIRPLCFEKHQPPFLKPCLQHSRVLQCADTIISYSKPFTTAIFPHPDKERRGRNKENVNFHLSSFTRDVSNFQCLVR